MNFQPATQSARVTSEAVAREAGPSAIEAAIGAAKDALLKLQRDDGHFVFELEADATIPAEYVLMRHYLAEPVDAVLEAKIANYLRRIQSQDGGWPLVHDGASNISAAVKAYYALKMIGVGIDEPYMKKARGWILSQGGASHSNVFTRNLLALFGAIPWTGVPVVPVEIMILPRWFPFHIDKISYWARTVLVPLTVLNALKPKARNPKGVGIAELFTIPPDKVKVWPKGPHQKSPWSEIFGGIDGVLRVTEPFFPKSVRKHSIDKAVAFVTERLNGEDGLGAIFPAMVNSLLVYDALGYGTDHPLYKTARGSIEKLVTINGDEAYCQPCLSPVWDTALSAHALMEVGDAASEAAADHALEWLKPLQVLDTVGDWAAQRPNVRPGGWAFQYANPHYPDTDDTAVVVMAMDRALGRKQQPDNSYREAISRAREWIIGMQSKNGGWGAFDADNIYEYLNQIPFSDHGALLDPPTADVTARCISMLAQLGERRGQNYEIDIAIDYLERTQEKEGSWFGRWGMNYIYGTWSVLCALNAAGVDPNSSVVRNAVNWLIKIQNADGGWGEDSESYTPIHYEGYVPAPSTSSQTAWALMGLMAAGEIDHPAVKKGVSYLTSTQGADGFWNEKRFTATGFPRVFYLRYHGYSKFFPMWALARYRNMTASNTKAVLVGM